MTIFIVIVVLINMNIVIIIILQKTNLSLDLSRGPGGEDIKILPLLFQSKLFIILITNFNKKYLASNQVLRKHLNV